MRKFKYLTKEQLIEEIKELEKKMNFYYDSPSDTAFDVCHDLWMSAREELKRREENERDDDLDEWYD